MTVQPTLSQLSVNNIRFGFENTQPLSHEQIVVSNHILHTLKTGSKAPKSVQLISQPQAGKTNTILNIVGLIDDYSLSRQSPKTSVLYFQPSDNELKDQLTDRFSHPTKSIYWNKANPDDRRPLPVKGFKIYTPSNIKGQAKALKEEIKNQRRMNYNLICIHDESHRDLGTSNRPANLPEFYADNQIMLTGMNIQNVDHYLANNKNHNNEIYINISASPASFIEYMKKAQQLNLPQFQTYYLKPHSNYLSFKDIAKQNRFKEGFEILNKKTDNVDRFMVEVVCQGLLLSEPGCLIVRLNPTSRSTVSIVREKVQNYCKYPELLISALDQYLDPALNTAVNIEKIQANLTKVNALLFSCNGDERLSVAIEELDNNFPVKSDDELSAIDDAEELEHELTKNEYNKNIRQPQEIQLVSGCHNVDLKIDNMDYFLKDEMYQKGEYRILFIMNSFLQGKTLYSLNKVRGWFDRFNDNEYHNNAFTIQSIGRNCGPYKNKNYTYPIWTNVNEINRIIDIFDTLDDHTDQFGLVDPAAWLTSSLILTGTYTKELSKKARKEIFQQFNIKTFSSFDYEAEIFSSQADAEAFITQQMQFHKNITPHNFITASVYNNDINDVIEDVLKGNYSRYRKTGYDWGLIHLDQANPNHTDSWHDSLNNSDSPLFNKHGYFIAYLRRQDTSALQNIDFIADNSCWKNTLNQKLILTTPTLNPQQQTILDELAQLRQQLADLTLKLQLPSFN